MSNSNAVFAVITEPQLPCYGNRKATILRPGEPAEAGAFGKFVVSRDAGHTLECPCGSSVSFDATQAEADKIVTVFCGETCRKDHIDDWLHIPVLVPSTAKTDSKSDKPKFCPECDGLRSGKGYAHTDDCSLKPQPVEREVKPPCTECDGPARGKGYTHVDGCSLKPKGYVKTGKPRGRPAIKGRRRKMPAGI